MNTGPIKPPAATKFVPVCTVSLETFMSNPPRPTVPRGFGIFDDKHKLIGVVTLEELACAFRQFRSLQDAYEIWQSKLEEDDEP